MYLHKNIIITLLLALRMRQISTPLVFLEYIFFHFLKSEFLQTSIMVEKSRNHQSLVEHDNLISASAMITRPTAATLMNTSMENQVVASENHILILIVSYSIIYI